MKAELMQHLWLMQVFFDAAAAKQARFSDSPALLVHKARNDMKHVMSEMASAEQEPSLAAARAAAAALSAVQRAIAGEALLASLTLALAEANTQVCFCLSINCTSDSWQWLNSGCWRDHAKQNLPRRVHQRLL